MVYIGLIPSYYTRPGSKRGPFHQDPTLHLLLNQMYWPMTGSLFFLVTLPGWGFPNTHGDLSTELARF